MYWVSPFDQNDKDLRVYPGGEESATICIPACAAKKNQMPGQLQGILCNILAG